MLLAVVMLGAGLGARDPWPPDEPRFAMMAQQMADSGQWLFPQRYDELYSEKPPLFMWAIATAYHYTGSLRVAFLLPSFIAGLVCLLLVYDLARRLWGHRVGMIAALVLLVTYQFTLQARTAQIDALACMFITAGTYGLWRHWLLGPAWNWCWLGFAAMGFGIITKGVGILPLLSVIPYVFLRVRKAGPLSALGGGWSETCRWGVGVLAMLAAISVWLIPMLIAVAHSDDPAFAAYRDNLLFHQTAERYTHSWRHLREPWYFLKQAPALWMPVTLLLPWLLPAWGRAMRRLDTRYVLPLVWVVLVVIFFSVPDGKRGVYILPATPALALAVAPTMPHLSASPRVRRLVQALVLGVGLIGLVASAYLGWIKPAAGSAALGIQSPTDITLWTALASAAAVALMGTLGWRRPWSAMIASIAVAWAIYGYAVLPVLNQYRSAEPLMKEVAQRISPTAELAMPKMREQFVLYADRKLASLRDDDGKGDALTRGVTWLGQGTDRWLLIASEDVPACLRVQSSQTIMNKAGDDWLLIRAAILPDGCTLK